MENVIIHNYAIKLNNEIIATAKDLGIAEFVYDKKLSKLIDKHSTHLCEVKDKLEIYDIEKDAIIKEIELN